MFSVDFTGAASGAPHVDTGGPTSGSPRRVNTDTRASSYLRERCPLCFAGDFTHQKPGM